MARVRDGEIKKKRTHTRKFKHTDSSCTTPMELHAAVIFGIGFMYLCDFFFFFLWICTTSHSDNRGILTIPIHGRTRNYHVCTAHNLHNNFSQDRDLKSRDTFCRNLSTIPSRPSSPPTPTGNTRCDLG